MGNALILAAIWKKTFVRTPFHILLSGLAITDLCTGLVAQPFVAAVSFIYLRQPWLVCERPTFLSVVGNLSLTPVGFVPFSCDKCGCIFNNNNNVIKYVVIVHRGV